MMRFLQGLTLSIGLIVIGLQLWLPMTEGRAADLALIHIYADPLILFAYATSIAFHRGLLIAFRWFGAAQRRDLTPATTDRALRGIRQSALMVALGVFIMGASIRLLHDPADDPAGVIMLSAIVLIMALGVAYASGRLITR